MKIKKPGREEHLDYIGNYPKREYEWSQFARLSVDLQKYINRFCILKEVIEDDLLNKKAFKENKEKTESQLDQIIKVINEIIDLKIIFSCNSYAEKRLELKDLLLTALKDAKK